jgi:hypothetical protein
MTGFWQLAIAKPERMARVTAVRARRRQGNWIRAARGNACQRGAERGRMRKTSRSVAAAKNRMRARSLVGRRKAARVATKARMRGTAPS